MNPLLIVSRYHILCNPTTPEAKGSLQLSLYLSWPARLLISALLHSSICEMEAWKMGEGWRGLAAKGRSVGSFFFPECFRARDSVVIAHETVSDKLCSVWKTRGECPPLLIRCRPDLVTGDWNSLWNAMHNSPLVVPSIFCLMYPDSPVR